MRGEHESPDGIVAGAERLDSRRAFLRACGGAAAAVTGTVLLGGFSDKGTVMTDDLNIPLLKRLEIIEACERLVKQFAIFGDSNRRQEWLELFAEDGEFTAYGQSRRSVGHAALRAVQSEVPPFTLVHVNTGHLVNVISEDTAEGVAYTTCYLYPPRNGKSLVLPEITPASVGLYHDSYRRTESGWRFARRTYENILVTNKMLEAIKYTDKINARG